MIIISKRRYYRNTVKNVIQIYNLLKISEQNGELLTVSKIAKKTGLHKWTVSRTLDIYMHPFVEITIPDGFDDIGLHVKFVRLKNPEMTKEQVMRFLKFKGTLTF